MITENTVDKATASAVSVTGLASSTTYYAKLITLSDNNDPDKKETASQVTNSQVTTLPPGASKPATPAAMSATLTSVTLSVTVDIDAGSLFGRNAVGTAYKGVYRLEQTDTNPADGTATYSDTDKTISLDQKSQTLIMLNLALGTPYWFRVVAIPVDEDQNELTDLNVYGDPVKISTIASQETAAAAPPNPTVIASYESISVTVPAYMDDAPQFGYAHDGTTERAGEYKLELYDSNTDSWSDTGKDIATDKETTVTISSLTAGTDYKVRIKAYPKEEENDVIENLQTMSAEVDAATQPFTAPGAPQNATVRTLSASTNMKVLWSVPESDGGRPITGYEVYWGTTSDVDADTGTAVNVDGTGTSVTITDLPRGGTKYYFAIYAINEVGRGDRTEATGKTAYNKPNDVQNFSISSRTATSITLSWSLPEPKAGTAPINGYSFLATNISTDRIEKVGFKSASATSEVVSGLKSETEYSFSIYTTSSGGGSSVGVHVRGSTLEAK